MNEPTNRNDNGDTPNPGDADRLPDVQADEEVACEYYGLELPDEHELDCLNCELVEICFQVYEELLEVEL